MRRPPLSTFVLLSALAGACTPIIPFHFAETAQVLDRGAVSLTVAGGGGGARDVKDCCGGGAARVDVGIGHKMSVGAEMSAIGSGTGDSAGITLGGKVRYKYAPIPYLALLAGVGAAGTVTLGHGENGELGLGADLGVVASTPLLARYLRIYGGARFSFVVPAVRDVYAAGGPTQAIVVPVGLSIEPNLHWRIFTEGGYVGGWSENRAVPMRAPSTSEWYGGYGTFAVAYVWGGRR